MSYRASARRGAIIGLGIGVAAALILLALGEFSTGEPMEGAMYLAMLLSCPIGLLFFGMGVGGPTSTWMPFIALAVPLNASMWGALFGVVRDRWSRPPSRPAA